VADQFEIAKIYDRWKEAVADPSTQAIVIGTWPNLHCPVTLAALEAGKHVLTEARMAMNASEARQMLEAANRKPELVTQVVPSPITLSVDRTIKRLLKEGYLGELLLIEVHHASEFIDQKAPMHWRQDVELSGCNIMMLGIWYEAIMRWVGPAMSVMAKGRVFTRTRKDDQGQDREVKVPEHVDVLAEMQCGAQLHLQQSAVTAHLQGGGIYLFGSEGVLRFADGTLSGARKNQDGLSTIEITQSEQGGWRVEEEFVNAIRGLEKVTHTTFADGLMYMEFTEAVNKSMQTGQEITLPHQGTRF
jgi:predicted dehydrogenase